MSNEIHSTGRGGQGNIGRDPTIYTDGSIVREGIAGPHQGESEYSTGRGGLGNIDHTVAAAAAPAAPAAGAERKPAAAAAARVNEDDYVPEPALRLHTGEYDNFHTGRGGQGNIYKEKYGGHSTAQEQRRAEHHHHHHSHNNQSTQEGAAAAPAGATATVPATAGAAGVGTEGAGAGAEKESKGHSVLGKVKQLLHPSSSSSSSS